MNTHLRILAFVCLLSLPALATPADANDAPSLKQVQPMLSLCDNTLNSFFGLSSSQIVSSINAQANNFNRFELKGELVRDGYGKIRVILIPNQGIVEVLAKAKKWERGLKLINLNGQCISMGSYRESTKGGFFSIVRVDADQFQEAVMIPNLFEKYWGSTHE